MKKYHLILLLGTAAWAAVCFSRVHSYQDPSGGDGYFYLKQIEWLGHSFQFYHADYSFVFFPLAFLYKITGSSLLSFQLMNLISLFAISSALGLIFMSATEPLFDSESILPKAFHILLGMAFAVGLAAQQAVLKLSFEFLKNGFAQALVLIGIYFYFIRQKKWALFFLLLGALTHKIAAFFLLVSLIFYFFKKGKFLFGALGALIVSLGATALLFPRFANHFKSFYENLSVESYFFMKTENLLLGRFVIGLSFVWLMVGAFLYRKIKDRFLLAMIVFSLVPFLPVFGGYNTEIKYRLFLLTFTFSAVIFARAWPLITNSYLRRELMVLSLAVLAFQATRTEGFPWVTPWSQRIQNLEQLAKVVGTDELITHHGLQFYIDYKTPIRARSLLAPDRKPKYQVAYNPEFYHLNDSLSDELRQIEILSLGSSYSLFEYEDFQNLMKQYPMLSDWRNVFQTRPDFVQDY